MNKVNFQSTLDYIKYHPEEFDQALFFNNPSLTKHCFISIAQKLSGKEQKAYQWEITKKDAQEFLDIDAYEIRYLTSQNRTLEDFDKFYEMDFIERVLFVRLYQWNRVINGMTERYLDMNKKAHFYFDRNYTSANKALINEVAKEYSHEIKIARPITKYLILSPAIILALSHS